MSESHKYTIESTVLWTTSDFVQALNARAKQITTMAERIAKLNANLVEVSSKLALLDAVAEAAVTFNSIREIRSMAWTEAKQTLTDALRAAGYLGEGE